EGGVRARVVRAGEPERNGLGCLREVRVGRRVRYVEEITAWQRPSAFEYMIHETSLPLRHAGSRLTFTPHGSGTNVEWTSRFEITVPILGRLLGVRARRIYAASFKGLLLVAKVRLEGAATQCDARRPSGGPEDVATPRKDGMLVQRRPCFAHDRRPGVEATGGGGLFLLPRCPRTGGVISERVCACPPS